MWWLTYLFGIYIPIGLWILQYHPNQLRSFYLWNWIFKRSNLAVQSQLLIWFEFRNLCSSLFSIPSIELFFFLYILIELHTNAKQSLLRTSTYITNVVQQVWVSSNVRLFIPVRLKYEFSNLNIIKFLKYYLLWIWSLLASLLHCQVLRVWYK